MKNVMKVKIQFFSQGLKWFLSFQLAVCPLAYSQESPDSPASNNNGEKLQTLEEAVLKADFNLVVEKGEEQKFMQKNPDFF